MNRKTKVVTGTGLIISLIGSSPILVSAANSSDDFIVGKTYGISESPFSTDEALFTPMDSTRRSFYSKTIKKQDKNAGNRLYKVSEDGFTYWSPVRPTSVDSGGVSTHEYSYENFYTAKLFDNGKGVKGWLNHLWVSDPNVSRNFKTKKYNIKRQMIENTKNDFKTIGKGVLKPDSKANKGGHFKNKKGEWRFNGYAEDGSSSTNPLFPPDYVSHAISKNSWNQYSKHPAGNKVLFTPTAYDTTGWKPAKKKLIKRLMEENPTMKYKTVNQWMKILSLQTAPEINPKTKKADGSYGGASFNAYHTNFNYYRSFVLLGNTKKQGSINMNLSKLVITENKKNAKGVYPVVATVSRKEIESRDLVNKKISSKLIPGKSYRVVSTVQNGNKLTSTKHNPTTTKDGYAVNYDGNKIETEGYYLSKYDKESKKATKNGKIKAGKSVETVSTFTMPKSLKAGSKVRFGSIIDDAHRKAGDNRWQEDDDLMLAVPVATGNLKAKEVVLVNEDGKEVKNPLPGHKYKMRYKFEYIGTTQKTKNKVTVNYQNTRKLPDGNQEAIVYKNGSQTDKDISASKDIVLKNNTSYSIDSKSYQWYEIPNIQTTATLSSEAAGLNTNNKDDTFKKTWNEEYDYSIENLQVIPRTERDGVGTDGKQHFGVTFTANNSMPKDAVKDNYAKDVNIRINLGGQTKVITEHLTAGKNKDIVVDFALDSKVKSGSVLNAKAEVNYDSKAYEHSKAGMSNNSATTKVDKSKLVKDEKTGEVVNPSNNSTNTGSYVDKRIDPNKETAANKDKTTDSWNQKYSIESWGAKKVTYKGMNGKKSYSFYRYTPKADSVKSVAQKESYKITDVLMKSKVTTDNKWGAKKDGWVSTVNDSGHAQVKAGYGYQLKMIVEYNTNAFSTEPKQNIKANGSGQSVRPQNVMPNITRDVYFQTPDGKILSSTGINQTQKLLAGKVLEQSKEKLVMEYTLSDTYAMGIKTPGRIYISEDTPNGLYKVRAWTPKMNGVATKNKGTDSNGLALYKPSPLSHILGSQVSKKPLSIPTLGKDANGNDKVDFSSIPPMSILVVGSDKDDLVNSVVQ